MSHGTSNHGSTENLNQKPPPNTCNPGSILQPVNCSADSFKLNTRDSVQYHPIFTGREKKSQETTFRIRSNVVYLHSLCSAAHIFKCRMLLLYCRVNFQLKDETRLSSSIAGICFYPFSRLTDVGHGGVCSSPTACIAHPRSWIRFYPSDPSLVTDRYMPHEACYHCS